MTTTRVPKGRGVRTEIRPFAEDELESFHLAASARDERLADILLIAAWTGLRWSELREARVRDFVRVPMPVLLVSRAAPEGVEAKVDQVRQEPPGAGRGPGAATGPGVRRRQGARRPAVHHQDAATSCTPRRSSARCTGRRLRPVVASTTCGTPPRACGWPEGVDPVTVQAWLGHASIATTNIYLHHLGSSADRAGLDRLNAPGGAGGARETRTGE